MSVDSSIIIGRARVAELLGRSERTVSRWIRHGVLPVTKCGPFKNSLLRVRVADLERLAAGESAPALVEEQRPG